MSRTKCLLRRSRRLRLMNKCEKCGFLHYRTDPCRKVAIIGHVHPSNKNLVLGFDVASKESESVLFVPQKLDPDFRLPDFDKPKRSGNRHRPGYFTEYMRVYRARIKAAK